MNLLGHRDRSWTETRRRWRRNVEWYQHLHSVLCTLSGASPWREQLASSPNLHFHSTSNLRSPAPFLVHWETDAASKKFEVEEGKSEKLKQKVWRVVEGKEFQHRWLSCCSRPSNLDGKCHELLWKFDDLFGDLNQVRCAIVWNCEIFLCIVFEFSILWILKFHLHFFHFFPFFKKFLTLAYLLR